MNSKFVFNKTNFDRYTTPNLSSCIALIHPFISTIVTLENIESICTQYNISLCLIRNHHYFQFGKNPTHIIRNFKVELMHDLSEFKVYPLYSLSHYSLPELRNIATTLQIPISKTRKQIYEDIQQEIQF